MTASSSIRLLGFKVIGKSGLAGFASVELDIGLRLFDLPVFSNGQSGPLVALPRKPSLDRERHQRVGGDGKPVFEPVAEWKDRDTSNAFSSAIVALISAAHPEAFQGGAT